MENFLSNLGKGVSLCVRQVVRAPGAPSRTPIGSLTRAQRIHKTQRMFSYRINYSNNAREYKTPERHPFGSVREFRRTTVM
jgi:hypothetical protein